MNNRWIKLAVEEASKLIEELQELINKYRDNEVFSRVDYDFVNAVSFTHFNKNTKT